MSYHVGLKWRSSDCLILFFLLLLSLTFLFNCIYIVDATLTMMEIPLNMNTSLRSLCWFKVICVCKFNIFFESGIVRFINPKTSTTLFGYLSPLTKIVLLRFFWLPYSRAIQFLRYIQLQICMTECMILWSEKTLVSKVCL